VDGDLEDKKRGYFQIKNREELEEVEQVPKGRKKKISKEVKSPDEDEGEQQITKEKKIKKKTSAAEVKSPDEDEGEQQITKEKKIKKKTSAAEEEQVEGLPAKPKTSPKTWTVDEVRQWLARCGFEEQIQENFQKAQINGLKLLEIGKNEKLKKLISSGIKRKSLVARVEEFLS